VDGARKAQFYMSELIKFNKYKIPQGKMRDRTTDEDVFAGSCIIDITFVHSAGLCAGLEPDGQSHNQST
jgi:hypothetical protein